MATILDIVKRVCLKIGVDQPDVLFSGTDRIHLELQDLTNDVRKHILKAHEWEIVKTLQTETGDDSTTAFDLPSDYDRMPKKQSLWSSRIQTPLTHVTDHDEWLEQEVRSYGFVIGVWTKLGGQIHIKPAMVTGETAKYYYINNKIVKNTGGTAIEEFSADTDTFRLDDDLLRLGMIYMWKRDHRMPYAEEMADFDIRLNQQITEDKGSRILKVGKKRYAGNVRLSYPETINSGS